VLNTVWRAGLNRIHHWTSLAKRAALGAVALVSLLAVQSAASMSADEAERLLQRADSVKRTNLAEFGAILAELSPQAADLPARERQFLHYLQGWQGVYTGDYRNAVALLDNVVADPADATLQFRARITLLNVQILTTRYQDAFEHMSKLLEQLPSISDPAARQSGLEIAAYLYNAVGEYDLALGYAERVIQANHDGLGVCRGGAQKLQTLYKTHALPADSAQFQRGVDACMAQKEVLYANVIRTYVINLYIEQGRFDAAIALLKQYYQEVQGTRSPRGISEWDSLLAQAYQRRGDLAVARTYALRAVEKGVKEQHTEPLVTAYRVLYEIASKQGDAAAALSYLEKYVSADKGYLDDVAARQLAYERVKHENVSNKLQIDALNKENQVLQLQRELGQKAAETSRLYIALLITVVLFIALWAYRTKRSQLYFMKLSQVDGLTGISNRPRFIQLAEGVLENALRTQQQVSVVLCDLDYFKSINDRFGHAAGDHVLKQAVLACQTHLRVSDIFGRFGGEEFGIVLPGCALDDARQRAERLRMAISAILVQEDGGPNATAVSASFGVACTNGSSYELRQLLAHADAALYQAKHAGRNRVVLHDPRGPVRHPEQAASSDDDAPPDHGLRGMRA
jgi:diguanylate cyclase (GGDEF)-like protein